jgi:hypothetical protein
MNFTSTRFPSVILMTSLHKLTKTGPSNPAGIRFQFINVASHLLEGLLEL